MRQHASWMFLVVASLLNACATSDLAIEEGLGDWDFYLENDTVSVGDVWQVSDGELMCKGTPKGYLYSKRDYTDFVLELDWRLAPGSTDGKGGVLFHMSGEHKIWPKCLEAQINAGGAGDFWAIGGYELKGPLDRTEVMENDQFGKLIHVKRTADLEKPAGEWNHYKITAAAGTVTLEINGEVVNEASGCDFTPGPILLTSEGTPIFFRNLSLR